MKIKNCLMAGAMLISAQLSAQGVTRTTYQVPLDAQSVVREITEDFAPVLVNYEMPQPGTDRYRMAQLKEEIKAKPPKGYQAKAQKTNALVAPTLMQNFEGNKFSGSIPNDNDMAISNGDKMVACNNTTIWFWPDLNDTAQLKLSLEAFSTILNIPDDKFDPRVIYDPEADRFVVTFLRGSTDTTNYIVVAFSQTNDPLGAWNFYTLPGNPFSRPEWSDYPIISLTKHELVITVNLVGTGEPWETGFKQTLIWQIKKSDGYSGQPLTSQMWSDIHFGGKPIRNLCPVRGGSGLNGPNLYLLSNRNFATTNDTIFVVELTDTIGGNDTLLINYRQTNTAYGFPPNGDQRYNLWLNTNDCRVLSAYQEGNTIHFAGNSNEFGSARASVYHGTVNITNNLAVTGTIISDSILDYGYPNLAYTGTNPGDDEFIMLLNFTADQVNAGMCAIYFDGTGYSETTLVKAGDNYINPPNYGSPMRWGDYSGAQRKYNLPGTVWVCGTFGRSDRRHATWIAELGNPLFVAQTPPAVSPTEVQAYPNPTQDRVSVEFSLEKAQNMDISLYDAQGRLVKAFIRDKVKAGKNEFSFSTADLPTGIYFLNLVGDQGKVASKKIVKNDR